MKYRINKKLIFSIVLLIIIFLSASLVSFHTHQEKDRIIVSIPPSLRQLKERIKNVNTPEKALKIVSKMYGEPDISLGSGLYIPQWKIKGGTLTFHEFKGVIYSKKSGKDVFSDMDAIYLIDTNNNVRENIISPNSYSISSESIDEAGRHDYFIGSLTLYNDNSYEFSKYQFMGDGMSTIENIKQDKYFFIKHPYGTYSIRYRHGVTKNSLLENIKSGTVLAEIKFTADSIHESFLIYSRGRSICLESSGGKQPANNIIVKPWDKSYHE